MRGREYSGVPAHAATVALDLINSVAVQTTGFATDAGAEIIDQAPDGIVHLDSTGIIFRYTHATEVEVTH